jgi:hypothetical protein
MRSASCKPKVDVLGYPSLTLCFLSKFQEVGHHFVSHGMCQKHDSTILAMVIQSFNASNELAEVANALFQHGWSEPPIIAGSNVGNSFYISKFFQ